jgi:hypothetical protein
VLFEAVTGRLLNHRLDQSFVHFDRVVLILLFRFLGTGLAVSIVVVAAVVTTLERLDSVFAGASIFALVFPSTQHHAAARELATLRTVHTDAFTAFATTTFGCTTVTQDVTVALSKAAAFTPEGLAIHHLTTIDTFVNSHALKVD